MGKETVVAAINGGNGKKVQGIVGDFETPDGKNVFVEFTEHKSSNPQKVPFNRVQWPHHKARSAAETKQTSTLAAWRKTNGINSAEEMFNQEEIAAYVPAD